MNLLAEMHLPAKVFPFILTYNVVAVKSIVYE